MAKWTYGGPAPNNTAYLDGVLVSNENFDFYAAEDPDDDHEDDEAWYDAGTKAVLQRNNSDDGDCNLGQLGGLFSGTRNGRRDGEMCSWEEFDIYDKSGRLVYRAGESID